MTLPPPNKKKISSLVALIFAGVPLLSYASTYEMTGGNVEFNEWDSNNAASFDELNINITPTIEWDYYTINADGKSFTVNNKTQVISISNDYQVVSEDHEPIAVYTFHAKGSSGVINLRGDIDAIILENTTVKEGIPYAGVNLFYAQNGGSINLGSTGSTVRAWALGKKPDLISAKQGGKVTIHSTNNQLVGNIDTLGKDFGSKGSSVTGTFSGADSFWFGDEQTYQNFDQINISASVGGLTLPIVIDSKAKLKDLLNREYAELLPDWLPEEGEKLASDKISEILDGLEIPKGSEATDKIELIFENGAQWTYFGDGSTYTENAFGATAEFKSTAKRISAITLNGGIINLFDEDIRNTWASIKAPGSDKSLAELWPDVTSIDHDYVRIGDLKGNGGIFRLDLNSDNQKNSDMVFIESSTTGGTHFIEPYRPQDLASLSDTNRLTFALVAANKDGSDSVRFADKQNIYGDSLFDYELYIGHETIDENNQELKDKLQNLVEENYETFKDDFDIKDYENGTHWYINRLLVKESAASIGMRSSGYASYDLAVSMDRRDRRLHNTVFQDGQKDGLWARIQYGEAGAEHLYDADLTTVYVGYENATSADNRLGFSFGYTDGSTDFNDVKGNGDLKRYEASIYDTLTFGSHYLDFVGRIGQVENNFDVTNQTGKLSTSGSFDQKYAALSVEYGFNYKDEHNVFIEPQLQLQAAYLDSYSYHTERNMKVKADSDISLIGRAGIRAGKTLEASNYAGELYARADVLHQFTDGQDADFSDLSNKVGVTWGDKDTWATFGIGSYFNWNDKMSFQVDIERTAGGETIDTWLISGRANYLF